MSSGVEHKGENPFQALIDEAKTEKSDLLKEISALERVVAQKASAQKVDTHSLEKIIASKYEQLNRLHEWIRTLTKDRAAHQSSLNAGMKTEGKDDPLCTVCMDPCYANTGCHFEIALLHSSSYFFSFHYHFPHSTIIRFRIQHCRLRIFRYQLQRTQVDRDLLQTAPRETCM